MHNLIYNEKSLSSLGFCIANPPKQSISKRSFDIVEIPGMDGIAISDNGIYQSVEMIYEINSIPYRIPYSNNRDIHRALAEWLSVWDGNFKILRDTYNEGYFFKAICKNIEPITEIAPKCLKTTINFIRQPFLYSDEGQDLIVQIASEDMPGVSFALHNPENFNSLPYIKIYGEGKILVSINGKAFNVLSGISEYIEIDSELKNAFCGTKNCNNLVDCDYMPEFIPGENIIKIYGIYDSTTFKTGKCTRVEIVPRWRCL